jgi:Uncharacterized protein conserved in bacteria
MAIAAQDQRTWAAHGLRASHGGILDFSVLDGNDLVTPRPEWGFPGLKPGDKWCVCVTRWKSALDHNRAAPVDLEATHRFRARVRHAGRTKGARGNASLTKLRPAAVESR